MYKIFASNKPLIITDQQQLFKENSANVFIHYQVPEDLTIAIDNLENLEELNSVVVYHNNLKELWKQIGSNFKIIEAAGGKVFNKTGDILFIERFNKWDLPKGKKESDEMPAETAIREVHEECGLSNVEIIEPLKTTYHTYKLGTERIIKKTYWFAMNYEGDEVIVPQKEEGIINAKWFPKNNLEEPLSNTYRSIQELF